MPNKQIIKRMKRDPRLKELWATMQERPLNLLEQIMLKQIVGEYQNGRA